MQAMQGSTWRGHAIGVVVAVVAFAGTVAIADTIHVPGDYPTIQAGIDAASDGDEVVVADGVWTGPGNTNLSVAGKDIVVRSTSGDPNLCVIDCEDEDWIRGFLLQGNGHAATLRGLTIRNATSSGIKNFNYDLTIRDCIITACRAADGRGDDPGEPGGGIYSIDSAVSIVGCVVSYNSAGAGGTIYYDEYNSQGYDGGWGGGLYVEASDVPVRIVNSVFLGNNAGDAGSSENTPCANGGHGGAIAVLGDANVRIWNCVIADNRAGGSGGWCDDGSGGDGGGVWLYGWVTATVGNSLIIGNSAGSWSGFEPWGSSGSGGGVAGAGGDVVLANCTVCGNSAGEFFGEPQGIGGIHASGTVDNTIVRQNEPESLSGPRAVRYSNVEGGYPGEGNIDVDPLFADPAGADYRLQPGSPCIDAGDNDAVPEWMIEDLDGNPRFVDDPDTEDTGHGDPPIIDMGAYEFQVLCRADLDDSGAVDFGDILAILSVWRQVGGPEDLDRSGTVDFGDLLRILSDWGACPHPYMGACCFQDGACIEAMVEAACLASGGLYRGAGSVCAATCLIGACCIDDGSCVDAVIPDVCGTMGGAYQGDGSNCVADMCLGACCFEDGTCLEAMVESECVSAGGIFRGGGSTCADGCPTGACCVFESCFITTSETCDGVGGTYEGDGTTCTTECNLSRDDCSEAIVVEGE